MGTKERELIKAAGIKIPELLKLLNSALADEWLAYYQYWTGSKVVEGAMKGLVAAELLEHANEELKHANMLADRIVDLGGMPVLEPRDWYKQSTCGYKAPNDPDVKKLLKQNIEGERCAIDVYEHLMEVTKDKDHITYMMSFEILKDEIEHEQDLEDLQKQLHSVK